MCDVHNLAFHHEYGYRVITIEEQVGHSTFTRIDQYELLQYTGLRDQEGVEIFEDYVLEVDTPNGVFLAKVVYEIGSYGLVALSGRISDHIKATWNDDFTSLIDIYWSENDDDGVMQSVKVVGNIYEGYSEVSLF